MLLRQYVPLQSNALTNVHMQLVLLSCPCACKLTHGLVELCVLLPSHLCIGHVSHVIDEQRVLLHCIGQVYHQSGEDGAISTVRAATDPSLTGQGFKYFGPWYKGGLVIHTGNESKSIKQHVCHAVYL